MIEWLREYKVLLGALSAASLFMFVGTLIAVPWLVVRLPADYFVHRRYYADRWKPRHPLLRIVLLAIKNLCGVVLVAAGVAMLLLPGQGILTILIGLMFLDFPGKYALERRLARVPQVLGAMNWMRAKANRPPLEMPGEK
jgi:hypothetical protein